MPAVALSCCRPVGIARIRAVRTWISAGCIAVRQGSPHGGWRPMAASRQSTREHELRASAWVRGMSGRAGFGYARVTGRSVDNDAGRGGNFLADRGEWSSPEANSELRLPDPDVTTRPAVKVRFAPYRDRRWLSPTGVWLTRLCTGAYPSYARMNELKAVSEGGPASVGAGCHRRPDGFFYMQNRTAPRIKVSGRGRETSSASWADGDGERGETSFQSPAGVSHTGGAYRIPLE